MRYFFWLFIIGLVWACTSEKEMSAPALEEEINIIPVNKLLFELDSSQMERSLSSFFENYPAFSELYFKQILPLKSFDNTSKLAGSLSKFLGDRDVLWLRDTCKQIFPDLNNITKELGDALAWYHFYFPERDIPDIYTFISAFQFQRFIFEDENGKDAVGLGLDLFLGADFPYQQMVPDNPNFSSFLSWTFDEKFISKKILELLLDDLMGEVKGNRLLDYMIHNGKKWYILAKLLPNKDFSIISDLTEEQLKWCHENELELWSFLLNQELFYESNFMKINKLIQPSPVAPPGMPSGAPGQTGNYLGWKIVQSFMRKNPDVTLKELMDYSDAQSFLQQSKYKPRKN